MLNDGGYLISPAEFIQGMCHGGYRSPASAIAELVDNSIEALATQIQVTLLPNPGGNAMVKVLDNGAGMTPTILQRCLRFGGTSRFNSRQGLGRFGLGLPASSLTYSRRVSVYSWRGRYKVYRCHLDVDEVADGEFEIRAPVKTKYPDLGIPSDTGTLVVWEKCDRLDLRRLRHVVDRINIELGRRFRRFLLDGVEILLNGESIQPVDPLMRIPDSKGVNAKQYGPDLKLAVRTGSEKRDTAELVVRFSELPVLDWYALSPAEKLKMGITRAAGVSILRSGREIDYGWFFVGGKRRENYDDWWRCEVEFSPVLDEEFGVAHTKQQIRPSDNLIEALTPIIEPVARTLGRRAREAHEYLALQGREQNPVIAVAESVDDVLEDITRGVGAPVSPSSFAISCAEKSSSELYAPIMDDGELALMFNASHLFYRRLNDSASRGDKLARKTRELVEALLLAAVRAEVAADNSDAQAIQKFRLRWGKILSCYMNQ